MKVLIVDDVYAIRSELRLVLEQSELVSSIVEAENGEDAIKAVIKDSPEMVILDLEMPRMGGFTFLRWLMQNKPLPVIIFSSLNSNQHIFKALEMGAVDFISKPKTYIDDNFKKVFFEKLIAASKAKVEKKRKMSVNPIFMEKKAIVKQKNISCLLIGASTGGPTAIQEVLKAVDKYLDIPILIAQHMPPLFTKVFAERLDSLLSYRVKEAENGEKLNRKTVYIAPGNMHMVLDGRHIELQSSEGNDIHLPSVDKLFISAANSGFEKIVAVVLTGMGNDGKKGVIELKKKGATIIAESSLTCVVYGMPKEAKATGCVDYDLARDLIGTKIIELAQC
jgi:two-component system chemotaxis response regulator CheB